MKLQLSSSGSFGKAAVTRFNQVLGEINIVLLAIAIGLAALDATCFVAVRLASELARPHPSTASAVSVSAANANSGDLEVR